MICGVLALLKPGECRAYAQYRRGEIDAHDIVDPLRREPPPRRPVGIAHAGIVDPNVDVAEALARRIGHRLQCGRFGDIRRHYQDAVGGARLPDELLQPVEPPRGQGQRMTARERALLRWLRRCRSTRP